MYKLLSEKVKDVVIKQSIHTKILRVTLIMLFVLAVLISSAGVVAVQKLSGDNSQLLIKQICDTETLRFDNKLMLLEHSVETIYEYANELRDPEGLNCDVLSDDYCELVSRKAFSIAKRTDGAIAVYFRYSPDVVGSGTAGFFWTKSVDGSYNMVQPTDILSFDAADIEHVGWYYLPKNAGKPMWMSPYLNKNLDIYMISYIMPFYIDDTFIGVIGMDIDFSNIMQLADDVEIYETGSVNLVSLSEHILYYCDENNSPAQKTLSTALYNHMTTINKSGDILKYTEDDGSVSAIYCNTLVNGMRLLVSVPLSEINANRNRLIAICTASSAAVFLISVLIIMRYTTRIVEPLKKLTEITGRYAEGKWDKNYICQTSDELQTLSESIAVMADTTQVYIEKINAAAKIDSLTGLKNKACYLEYTEKLIKEPQSNYAVVVCDLNYLKRANDTYGHEAGDKLLCTAGKYICGIFCHSPVFRIGGDEFVALLMSGDYDARYELMEKLRCQNGDTLCGFEDIRLSVACGMASAPEDGESYEELFNIADKRMYENKKEMKAVRTD